MSFNALVGTCIAYAAFLFAIAFVADRQNGQGWGRFLRSPFVYTLSLSIYCTGWTFYGAVGYAARSGLEFVTIYLGPSLVFAGWWLVLRKLVRAGREQRVTSIADLISSRYGKSNALAMAVTVLAVVATTPYIALQLQSVSHSFAVFVTHDGSDMTQFAREATAPWVAFGLALFTIIFGTRRLDAREQHQGVVIAIAVEAVVKLVALVAVGVFVVWGLAGGIGPVIARIAESPVMPSQIDPGRWAGLILLSGFAVLTLPRMFQVMVVENTDESHLAKAAWAFPLYLFVISLFILPIAVVGTDLLPPGSNPDLMVLTLPIAQGQDGLALLAFLGGFSSASSMVIVETIALATMLSNHVALPIWLLFNPGAANNVDLRGGVLMSRRVAVAIILALGLAYYQMSGGSAALAAIGLIAFVGMAQVVPALIGGLFWRAATGKGALAGMGIGALIWTYCLFLPSFGPGQVLSADVMTEGAYGISWLRPQALFGVEGMDPLLHALFWSLFLNSAAFCLISLLTFPGPMERVQSASFVAVFDRTAMPGRIGWVESQAEPEQLLSLAQRIMGEEALAFFEAEAVGQGKAGYLPDITPQFLARLERAFAGSVGAATAHAMISQFLGSAMVTVEDLMAVANETAQIMETSARLEAQQEELTRTARQLRDVNERLTQMSLQKDSFLGQVSHELRTPMTSIRAFSEILTEGGLDDKSVADFGRIIHEEAIRLTRLLDDLLDLNVLESGSARLNLSSVHLGQLLDRAVAVASQTMPERDFVIHRNPLGEEIFVQTDADRLVQVFINLISNARKYCQAEWPDLTIALRQKGGRITVDFIDNGTALAKEYQALIFEKFSRLHNGPGEKGGGGAGLGLAICREIMTNLGGAITYLPGQGGVAFRVTLPLRAVGGTAKDRVAVGSLGDGP